MQLDVNVLHILGISVSTFTEILTMTNILRQLDIDIMIPRNGATLLDVQHQTKQVDLIWYRMLYLKVIDDHISWLLHIDNADTQH